MPRLFDCCQMSELSSAKREEPGWNRRLWGALPTAGHPEIKKKRAGGGKESREQTHKSGSDPGNARLLTMCSVLLQSLLWNIPLLPQPQGWRVCKEGGFHLSHSPLSCIHSASGVGSGWDGWVAGPERHFTDEKSPHGNG